MPTYEYECKSCGHSFDVFQSMSDAPLKICPQCGSELRRLINGGTGVIFKGSGFYVTDKNKSSAGTSSNGNAARAKKEGKAPAAADAPAKTGAAEGAKGGENKAKTEISKV
ncbi:MAG: zinc ribbon domain-containing protein [Treponema sp.]|jgi:putative FmdB family regulatory protein|nr:zinc ribbon domain-containing protein [Treponema sp.]